MKIITSPVLSFIKGVIILSALATFILTFPTGSLDIAIKIGATVFERASDVSKGPICL